MFSPGDGMEWIGVFAFDESSCWSDYVTVIYMLNDCIMFETVMCALTVVCW